MKTYTITQKQINILAGTSLEADLKCKAWFPDAFKKELEVGKWYSFKTERTNWLMCYNGNLKGYGFNTYNDYNEGYSMLFEINWMPATNEEVETALINEAKKRCYDKGCTDNRATFKYNFTHNYIYFNGIKIFQNGTWATIIEQPLTIEQRLERIEKQLNIK